MTTDPTERDWLEGNDPMTTRDRFEEATGPMTTDMELEEVLGWPFTDGNQVTMEHRAFCREHGHAPDFRPNPSPLCARCGEPR